MFRLINLGLRSVDVFSFPDSFHWPVMLPCDCEQAPAESVTSSEQPPQTPPSVVENDDSYRRADSDYSIDSLWQLFNAGEDATSWYVLANQQRTCSLITSPHLYCFCWHVSNFVTIFLDVQDTSRPCTVVVRLCHRVSDAGQAQYLTQSLCVSYY